MVVDNDLGLGSFLPITEEDREIIRQAKMLNIRITLQERNEILWVARELREWQHLPDGDFDQRVFDEVAVRRYPRSAPSLLDVRVVMAALRAGHLS
ncbi:hypothetical protein AB0K35_26210 [Micromonospora sp. NPDC053740]|uniref:hypothetical protein n=1 Tax=Micromonospora sp. NPDC053740 TaxID=3155173 RepID=UPI0034167A37